MVLTASNMLPLGTTAPEFELPNVITGNLVSLENVRQRHAKAMCVMFICNHCPYVQHIWDKMVEMANDYMKQGVVFIAINSNDVHNYPDDAPDKMKALAEQSGFEFPYLFDEDQTVAKAYHAACTPDIYLFDSYFKLVYRGEFDGSRPGNEIPVTGDSLMKAIEAVKEGRHVKEDNQKPSIGCNIKWK